MIVAIDGPAGSGKSTTARAAAEALGFLYIDTGAMYRAAALAFLREDLEAASQHVERVALKGRIGVAYEKGEMRVLLGGEDVTERVRDQDVGRMASQVSALPAVREELVAAQRRIAQDYQAGGGAGVVLDGRDVGTVIFPEAEVKVFMVAGVEERARRRQAQLRGRGTTLSLSEVKEEIEARDQKDRARDVAPLRRAGDAVELDTTRRTVQEQVHFVVERVRERQRRPSC